MSLSVRHVSGIQLHDGLELWGRIMSNHLELRGKLRYPLHVCPTARVVERELEEGRACRTTSRVTEGRLPTGGRRKKAEVRARDARAAALCKVCHHWHEVPRQRCELLEHLMRLGGEVGGEGGGEVGCEAKG